MSFISLLLLGVCARVLCVSCSRLWFVCEVVLVPYVDALTVMCVLLFMLDVSMLRVCEDVRMTAMMVVGDGEGVVRVTAGHGYVGGISGSGECGAWGERSWWSMWNVYVFSSEMYMG